MSSVLTLNGGVLVTQNGAPLAGDATTADIQASKSYTVAASGSQTIAPDTGYDAMEAVALSVPGQTLPTATSSSATSGYTSKATVSRSTSDQYINIPTGFNSAGAYYKVNAVPNGTATSASSISGTGATASSSSTTITLSKSVSNTPRITTAGYISSGTAGNSSVSLSATDANFLPENIKKNISIFGKTGTYEGAGGTTTLKMGVVRPDAELVQTWSGDYLVHADKEVTIPTYSTTSTTLVAAAAQTTTATLTNASYRYYVLERFLTIPQYSITTKAAGRQEYHWSSYCYEIVYLPANSVQALVDTTAYASRNTAVFVAGAQIRQLYCATSTTFGLYTSTSYGVAQVVTAPAVSSGTAASPTLTVTAPSCTIRGSGTYLSKTYYNAITDIRCQYVIELYRVPLSTTSTYGIDGWGVYSQTDHILDCVQTSTHKLT